jgi:hypothetical protein
VASLLFYRQGFGGQGTIRVLPNLRNHISIELEFNLEPESKAHEGMFWTPSLLDPDHIIANLPPSKLSNVRFHSRQLPHEFLSSGGGSGGGVQL